MERGLRGFKQRLEFRAAFLKWLIPQIAIAFAEQIEEDNGCWCCGGKQFDARGSGMNAKLQGIEIELAFMCDDEFAVEYAFCRKLFA